MSDIFNPEDLDSIVEQINNLINIPFLSEKQEGFLIKLILKSILKLYQKHLQTPPTS